MLIFDMCLTPLRANQTGWGLPPQGDGQTALFFATLSAQIAGEDLPG